MHGVPITLFVQSESWLLCFIPLILEMDQRGSFSFPSCVLLYFVELLSFNTEQKSAGLYSLSCFLQACGLQL